MTATAMIEYLRMERYTCSGLPFGNLEFIHFLPTLLTYIF